jgi:uncharacterized Zn-finger protein
MIIEKDDAYKFIFDNDSGLQNAFESITERDRLQIKLMKKRKTIQSMPFLKPIVVRRSDFQVVEEEQAPFNRKDSGISFEQDLRQFHEKQKRKLPALSNIVTTQQSDNYWAKTSLPSPPTNHRYVKLPGLSSFMFSHPMEKQQSQLAPIYNPNNFYYSATPLSPPLSARSPVAASLPTTASTTTCNKMKRPRGRSVPQQSQFICEHVVDPATGKTCNQAFRRSYDLSRHQSIHLKNRPLCSCRTCGKKFTRLDALRRHERIQGHNK